VTTRPRRRQPGTPAPRHRDPSPQAPPSVARGLVRAGSPTGPIRAAGCPRLGSPPTGAGTGGIDSTVTAVVMAAVRAATTCCGSTAAATLSRPSLVAVAALPASCGAWMSAASWGRPRPTSTPWREWGVTVGVTLRTRRRENQTPTFRGQGARGSGCLPQGGEAPLPLPWGLDGRCVCG
jgi:hypothetical protein